MFLVFSAFFGVSLSYGKVYLVHIALLVCSSYFLYFTARDPMSTWKRSKPYLFLLYYWAFLCLSALWAKSSSDAFLSIVQLSCTSFVAFYAAFFFPKRIERNDLRITDVILLGTFLFAIVESITHLHWPISKYSPYAELFGKTGLDEDIQDVLPSAFFWAASNLSLVAVISTPYFFNHKNAFLKLVGILIIPIVLIRASSRLGLIALSIYYLYKFLKVFFKHNYTRKLKIVCGLVLVVLCTYSFLPDQNKKDFRNLSLDLSRQSYALEVMFSSKESIDVERLSRRERMMIGTFNEWLKAPVFGNGAGHLVRKYYEGTPLVTPHLYPFEVLATTGVFGALLYLLVIRRLLRFKRSVLAMESILLFVIALPIVPTVSYFFPVWLYLGLLSVHVENAKMNTLEN